ncbi:Imm31 family immunity protein [Gimesia chilikensis]|uniref:Imm31 family immunity protein n=1 Tax=Gimesia chilikensis TaxID=2605989 RepID=UPI0018D5DD04|nr:Imm31 family immunity protein [Gimesia chilikensis]
MSTKKNQFQFYEVVVVEAGSDQSLRGISGEEGAILGMSQDEETGCWGYAVSLFSTQETWDVSESQLIKTGRMKQRSDFYSGDSIRVIVDPESGEGSLKE